MISALGPNFLDLPVPRDGSFDRSPVIADLLGKTTLFTAALDPFARHFGPAALAQYQEPRIPASLGGAIRPGSL